MVSLEKLLIEYQLCVIEEGDYSNIRAFPHALLLGGSTTELPPVEDVIALLEYSNTSLIIDLSLYHLDKKISYLTKLMHGLCHLRTKRGKPHWFLIDEAHYFCPLGGSPLADLILQGMKKGGFGIISYRLSQLDKRVLKILNYWMLTSIKDKQEVAFIKNGNCNVPLLHLIRC